MARVRGRVIKSPIEKILTDDKHFGVDATLCQRGICRVIDGFKIPDVFWKDENLRLALNNHHPTGWAGEGTPEQALRHRPFEVVLVAGIRGGKSMMCAAMAMDRAIHSDLSWLKETESEPLLPIISVRKHNAEAVFRHVRGLATRSPLAEYVESITTETIVVRNAASDRLVTILVTASSRAASNVASYWLVSCIFDEAPKMTGREESVLNLEDAQVEVRERVIEGGQVLYVGSPWAPEGPVYRMVQESWDSPSLRRVVIRATGPMLNPKHWTQDRLDRLSQSTDAVDREIYQTSGLGEFLEKEENLVTLSELREVTRSDPLELEPIPTAHYVAAMDPATRRNAWTLVVACLVDGKLTTAVARQWVPLGPKRIDPEEALSDIAAVCARFRVTRVLTDQWSVDTMRALAAQRGLQLVEMPALQGVARFHHFDALRLAIQTCGIELPPLETLQRDLLRVKKRVTPSGMAIRLPETADGRHCDFVPPLALIIASPPRIESEQSDDEQSDEERAALEFERTSTSEWLDDIAARL